MALVPAPVAAVTLRPRPKRGLINANSRLVKGLIFEVGDGGWEPTICRHVGVPKNFQPQPIWNGFSKCPILENAVTNDLASDVDEHLVFTRSQNVDPRALGL